MKGDEQRRANVTPFHTLRTRRGVTCDSGARLQVWRADSPGFFWGGETPPGRVFPRMIAPTCQLINQEVQYTSRLDAK